MARAPRVSARSVTTRALLLRRVSTGETDLVVTFFTEEQGRVSLLARGARRSQKRFGGALEPMHTLCIRYDDRPGADLGILREASLETPRANIVHTLARLEAAGRALSWVRHAVVPRTPEPEAWQLVCAFLDRVAATDAPERELAEFGLSLLGALGFGLELSRCVACGKACEPGRAGLVDARRGGLLCRACGGARLRLSGEERERFAAAAGGQSGVLLVADARAALALVEEAMAQHMGLAPAG